jgi:hypothetical protein
MHPVYPLLSLGEKTQNLGRSKSFPVCLSVPRNEKQSVKFQAVYTIWLNALHTFWQATSVGQGG